jgi:hypothetical protein
MVVNETSDDGGRVTLVGAVANTSDKQLAGVHAREVTGVFQVTNELLADNSSPPVFLPQRSAVPQGSTGLRLRRPALPA